MYLELELLQALFPPAAFSLLLCPQLAALNHILVEIFAPGWFQVGGKLWLKRVCLSPGWLCTGEEKASNKPPWQNKSWSQPTFNLAVVFPFCSTSIWTFLKIRKETTHVAVFCLHSPVHALINEILIDCYIKNQLIPGVKTLLVGNLATTKLMWL